MEFRGIRLGALLVPLGVAIIPVSVLLWYGFVRIPAQEAYLNERNLRLLTTLSGPIKAKVDSLDGALDHAVRSFAPTGDEDGLKRFRQGVHLFAPDLDVLDLVVTAGATPAVKPLKTDASSIEAELLQDASDPPRVRIERDEGRYYLYVGARLKADHDEPIVSIVARSELDTLVAPFLEDSQEFAAVLLTTESGVVITQKSPVGLSLARLDGIIENQSPQSVTFDSSSQFSNMMAVTIGGVEYKLYIQPVPLSLLSMKGSAGASRHSEQWVLCGLVRADRFRADSSSIPYPALLWFSGLLAVVALAVPFVKLRALSARERLRASDLGWVTAMTFMAIGLLTLGGLDVYAFRWQVGSAVDARLKTIAGQIAASVTSEVQSIDRQGIALESGIDEHGKPIGEVFSAVSKDLRESRPRRSSPKIVVGDEDPPGLSCQPKQACRINVLNELSIDTPYPFFDLVTWAGQDGWQRVRTTPGPKLLPFMNIKDEKLPYYPEVHAAWQAGRAAKGASVLESKNTGEPLTVFWRTGQTSEIKWVQSLAMKSLVSLDQPLLPKGVSFAVVTKDGQVLFHSIRNRRLKENFLKECEDDARLQSALQNGRSASLSASYLGHPNRLYVVPLEIPGFENPGWRLAVFQNSEVVDTVNLETFTIACWLFGLYAGVLAFAAVLIYAFAPQHRRKWFWPDAGKASAYRAVVLVNGAAVAVFVVVFAVGEHLRSPNALLVATVALAITTAAATFRIVVRTTEVPGSSRTSGVWHHFFLARAAFLLVVAGLPAIACFQAAYAFETRLLARSERAQHERDVRELSDRIIGGIEAFRLETGQTGQVEQRRLSIELASNNHDVSLWPGPKGSTDALGSKVLDNVLMWMHRPYNPDAIELGLASVGVDAAQSPSTALGVGWLVVIVGLLFAACYAFLHWFVRPIFVLEAVAPPVLTPNRDDAPSEHVLIVGPPGSGKSTWLARNPKIRICDLARLACAERDTFDFSTLPPVLGIDHLDYRLEERECAAQTLQFVERAIYREGCSIWMVSDRDPFVLLEDSGAPPAELNRWARALRSFRRETFGLGRWTSVKLSEVSSKSACTSSDVLSSQAMLDECRDIPRLVRIKDEVQANLQGSPSGGEALVAFGSAASQYYEALWRSCTVDERLTLQQLAEEGLVNPRNQVVVRNLLRAGLIVRDPVVRIMNTTFGEFVLRAASADQVKAWERRGVLIPWGSIEGGMLTVVVGLAGLLVVTQEHLLNAWIGFVPTLVPTAQKLWNAFAAARAATKGGVAV